MPCVMVALNLCLLGVSIATEPEPQPAPIMMPSKPATQDGDTVTFTIPPEPKTNIAFEVALLLNFPAFYTGIIVGALTEYTGEATLLALRTILVFPLWFRIGRWIDRQRVPAGPPRLGPVRDTLRGFGRILAGFLLLACLYEFSRDMRYKFSSSEHRLLGCTIWCATYLALSFWGGRREKRRVASV